ncbi:MAG: sigma-70 family RNA polymerase sigma factor [Flavisolibacter sp.]|nr:sigma-70 family RNA polymerase sigma factor [Flavisolibacter sp.]
MQHTVDHLFRHEAGKMIAVLSKLLGLQNLETAQDLVQDTLLQAMSAWSYGGLPDNPSAWLYRVARNKAIDYVRRQKRFKEISPQYSYLLQSEYTLTPTINNLFLEDEIQDSQLRMIFACCHPSIPVESQIALALKTLCGLSTTEIARAFLTSEETIAKRIYRAKEKIRIEKIELELPSKHVLPERLDTVLRCLYLLFNEGYNSSHPDYLIREELCEEAIRLTFLLTQSSITNLPRTQALLALLCFQASRLRARLDDKGNIILLRYQDRGLWYRPLMEKGFTYLEAAMEQYETTPYHLEAAIASLHAAAPSFEATDWPSIYSLYNSLYHLYPTPIVALNRAIAAAYAVNKETALHQLLQIKDLEHYYLYHTALGEVYFELGNKEQAKEHYRKALQLTTSRQEQHLLHDKMNQCAGTM